MATPIIDPRTSILSVEKGGSLLFQPAATNNPTSWSASGLPDGLTVNGASGALSGTVTAESGVYAVTLTATNASGSGQLVILIPVFVKPDQIEGEITIEINVDLITGGVSVIGMDGAEFGPPTAEKRDDGYNRAVMLVKEGDRFPVSIGFTRDGVLQDLDLRSLKMRCKEFEPDGILGLLESAFSKTGEGDKTRFASVMNIKEGTFAGVLSNYEEDDGTYLDALSEIEFSILASSNSVDSTKVAAMTLTGDDSETDVLSFTGIPKIENSANYQFSANLSVTGASAQNVALSFTGDVAWNGNSGVFDISNIQFPQVGQGAASSGVQWQTTFEVLQVVGTSDGFDVTVKTTTTDLGDWDIISFPEPYYDEYFYDTYYYEARQTDNYGGSYNTTSFELYGGEGAQTIKDAIEENGNGPFAGAVNEVLFANGNIIIKLNANSGLHEIEDFYNSQIYTRSKINTVITKSGSHSVRAVGDNVDDIYRRTSETFITRVERDMIADL